MQKKRVTNTRLNRGLAIVGAVFGAMTLFAAGSVLGGFGRDAAGSVVSFVLWGNLFLGVAYIAAAYLLWTSSPLARPLAFAISGATVLVAIAFVVTASGGTPVEPRTGIALAFRAGFWLAIGLLAPKRPS